MIRKVLTASEEFIQSQMFGGFLLVLCTAIALIWANSPWSEYYFAIDHYMLGFNFQGALVQLSLSHWVNDGLMAIFFLLVGLEIKREILAGELSVMRKAALPIVTAIGGMVVPALIYLSINHHSAAAMSGWGVPMATDIAYALGVMAIFGRKAPSSLLTLLMAIAIVDDLGAIVVIALFYSKGVVWFNLIMALGCWLVLWLFNWLKVKRLAPYLFVGFIMWMFMLGSGVHATIAGVMLAAAIPGRSNYDPIELAKRLSYLVECFDRVKNHRNVAGLESESRKTLLSVFEHAVVEVETPLQKLEHALHIPVMYFIIPLFVLFNAGINFGQFTIAGLFSSSVTMGIVFGLIVGKVIGIFGSGYVACRLGWVDLPEKTNFKHLLAISFIAGIGFTMAIFIAELAFAGNHYLADAKVGILLASLLAAMAGSCLLYLTTRNKSN